MRCCVLLAVWLTCAPVPVCRVVEGYGIDFREDSKVIVFVRSIEASPHCDIPPPAKGAPCLPAAARSADGCGRLVL